jgi:hypothetical protein
MKGKTEEMRNGRRRDNPVWLSGMIGTMIDEG